MGDLSHILANIPKNSYFIFRQYHLPDQEREETARSLLSIAKKYKIKFIVAQDINLALKIKADGVHFSDNKKIPWLFWQRKSFKKDFILSYSCHNIRSAIFAKRSNIDLVFISPIFTTQSHDKTKLLGKIGYLKALYYNKEIMPLGGINDKNINFINKTKTPGFGAIDYFIMKMDSS